MALPRGLIVVAASALAAGAVLYVRNKMMQQQRRSDETKSSSNGSSSSSSSSSTSSSSETSTSQSSAPPVDTGAPQSGSVRELSLFLAGESWYDEVGWQGIWEREGIESPEQWLRTTGKDVLTAERKKLAEHPALLAGCRRRWIVVCRYASIDVTDAATLWNNAEA
jgi:hypothetical protein